MFVLSAGRCSLCLLFVSLLLLAVAAVSARCAVFALACRRWSCVSVRVACRVLLPGRAGRSGGLLCLCAVGLVCAFVCCPLLCRRRRFCVRALRRGCCRCPWCLGRRCRWASFLWACCRRGRFACPGCGGLPAVFGGEVAFAVVPAGCGWRVFFCASDAEYGSGTFKRNSRIRERTNKNNRRRRRERNQKRTRNKQKQPKRKANPKPKKTVRQKNCRAIRRQEKCQEKSAESDPTAAVVILSLPELLLVLAAVSVGKKNCVVAPQAAQRHNSQKRPRIALPEHRLRYSSCWRVLRNATPRQTRQNANCPRRVVIV